MLVLGSDADRPLRDAEEEVDRAVERIDDPAHAARALEVAALLPQHAVVGPRGGDPLADQVLGVVVGLADEVGRRALARDPQLRAVERVAQERARLAGDRLGQRAQLAGRHAATAGRCDGPVARLLELGRERDEPRLGVGRADELHAEREAVGREAGGHRDRGLAGVVEGAGVGREARVAGERPEAAAAVVLAHAQRPAGEHRSQHDVAFLEDPVEPLGVGRGWAAAASASRLRDRRADPREPAGAAREPLAVADLDAPCRRARARSARARGCRASRPSRTRARRPRGRGRAGARRSSARRAELLRVRADAERREPDRDRDPQPAGRRRGRLGERRARRP